MHAHPPRLTHSQRGVRGRLRDLSGWGGTFAPERGGDRARSGRVGGQLIVRVITGALVGKRRSQKPRLLSPYYSFSCLASQRWSEVIPQGKRKERKSPEQERALPSGGYTQDCLLNCANLPFYPSEPEGGLLL